jgi:hypothetical protein
MIDRLQILTRPVFHTQSLPVGCPWSVVLSGYSASSTTKTGRHDIAEILLKVVLNTINQSNQIMNQRTLLGLSP